MLQVLHAQQQQRQRLKALERFRSDATAVLVATDVAARGLDIPDVATVVQYQLPPTADTYIHRAGRTARAGAEGVCVSLVVPGEAARFAALHTALDRPAPRAFPVDSAVMADVQARIRLAQRIDELERGDKKAAADGRWRQQNAEAIGAVLLVMCGRLGLSQYHAVADSSPQRRPLPAWGPKQAAHKDWHVPIPILSLVHG